MNWARFGFGLTNLLSIALILRLVLLRLHTVYRIFCVFLLFQVLTSSLVLVEKFTSLDRVVDYRVTWLCIEVGVWVLWIWMVYALLHAILENLPGILKASKRALNVVFPMAIGVAAITAAPEYVASGASRIAMPLDFLVNLAFIVDRAIATVALLTILVMLAFILWFPVRMPRNLAVFSLGFIVYFSAQTALLLLRSFWAHENFAMVDDGVTVILCACLVYWIIFINSSGEQRPVTLGHSWQTVKRTKLIGDLEALNASLARAGRR